MNLSSAPNEPRVAVVTDSAASLPQELVELYGIRVIPLLMIFEQQTYRDGVDMTPAEFYQRLQRENELPTTSTPSLGEFVRAYEEAGRRRQGVVSIHLATELSQTYGAASQAAKMVGSAPVHVLDTRTALMAQGFVALVAAKAASSGADVATVIRVAQDTMRRARFFLMVDTLEYLHRGGRIGGAAALVGSALRLKPILQVTEGRVEVVERPRTRSRAIERMLELMVREVGDAPAHLCVMHADALEAAEELRARVSTRLDCVESYLTEFTPAVGTHTGPGLGLAFYAGQDRYERGER